MMKLNGLEGYGWTLVELGFNSLKNIKFDMLTGSFSSGFFPVVDCRIFKYHDVANIHFSERIVSIK